MYVLLCCYYCTGVRSYAQEQAQAQFKLAVVLCRKCNLDRSRCIALMRIHTIVIIVAMLTQHHYCYAAVANGERQMFALKELQCHCCSEQFCCDQYCSCTRALSMRQQRSQSRKCHK
eukprot:14132-Heterococcus_DN1.PRE.11